MKEEMYNVPLDIVRTLLEVDEIIGTPELDPNTISKSILSKDITEEKIEAFNKERQDLKDYLYMMVSAGIPVIKIPEHHRAIFNSLCMVINMLLKVRFL